MFQQTIDILMDTKCAPLLADLLRQTSSKDSQEKISHAFYSSFRYVNVVVLLNNSRFGNYLNRIYHNELQIKDTTYTQPFAYDLDLYLEMDNGETSKTKSNVTRKDTTTHYYIHIQLKHD